MEIRFVSSHDIPESDAELPAPVAQVFDFSGRVLRGRYRLRRRLGGGGMGIVYEARDLTFGTSVAVKLIHPELSRDPDFRRRFLREARLGVELRHHHGVAVSDLGETEDGVFFLVMEHLEGHGLDAVLAARGRPLPWQRVCTIAVQLCSVLQEAHARGIVHRDIKPGNCFLVHTDDGSDFVKLLDLGLAKLMPAPGEHTSAASAASRVASGRVLGTPEYMSPEQARGLVLDHRVDLYALGVTMYKLLTGQLPFAGSPPGVLLRRQIDELPRPPHELAPGVELPSALEAVVLRALAKRPDDRYQSAAEFAAAIRAAQELGEFEIAEIEAEEYELPRVPPPRPAATRPFETRRAAAGLGAAGIALALAAISSVIYTMNSTMRGDRLADPTSATLSSDLAPPPSTSARPVLAQVPVVAPSPPAGPEIATPAALAPLFSAPPTGAGLAPAAPASPPARAVATRRLAVPPRPTGTGPSRPVLSVLPPQTGARILGTIAPGVARCARVHGGGLTQVEVAVELDGASGTPRAVEFPDVASDPLRRCVRPLVDRLRFPAAADGRIRHSYPVGDH